MTNTLSIHAVHQDGMRVLAGNGTHEILMDYPLPGQTVKGLTPLETLLASLCACSATTVKLLLTRKLHQQVASLEVHAHAVRRREHPTVLTEIALEFVIAGDTLDPRAVESAIKIAEEQLCPVWNMLKGGTTIKSSFRIVPAPVLAVHPA